MSNISRQLLRIKVNIGDLGEIYEDTILNFLRDGQETPSPEVFIIYLYDNKYFDKEMLETWFKNPYKSRCSEFKTFIYDLNKCFHLYNILENYKEE